MKTVLVGHYMAICYAVDEVGGAGGALHYNCDTQEGKISVYVSAIFPVAHVVGLLAQWIRRLPTEQKIPGSIPGQIDKHMKGEFFPPSPLWVILYDTS